VTFNLYWHVWDPSETSQGREVYGNRRATFADRGWEDVDPSIPQTPHRAGLTVAMFDGGVRTVAPSVDETLFWAQVTPAGGEVVPD
jgi:hypothetical protein